MSRIDPIDEFVLNHGNPNSADYKRAQSRLELDKLDELKKLNNNGEEEYVHPYIYGIHPVLDFFHKIAEVFCNAFNFITTILLALMYFAMAGVGIYILFMIFFGK